jgi:hypothetical protein
VIELRNRSHCGADALPCTEGNIGQSASARIDRPTGVEERGMLTTGVSQEPGRARSCRASVVGNSGMP